MSDSPLLSVIIPVYNSAQYLMRAVDSIKEQKYPNLEIILIDDGSTDGSDILCDILSKHDNQIKTIHSKNEGPAVARNKGLDVANGKYIYFSHSFLCIRNNKIHKKVTTAQSLRKLSGC